MTSEESYLNLLVPFENWLSERVDVDEFKEMVAYVKNEWQKNQVIHNMIKKEDIIAIL